jgi:Translation elongation factors (GTPases)
MNDIKSETITGGRPGSGAHRVVALCGPYLSGKTSLLESILYATGAIGRRGSTRAGTSIGDGLPRRASAAWAPRSTSPRSTISATSGAS